MAEQSIKAMIDSKDIAALAVFLASDAAKSISGQVLPIDNDRQRASCRQSAWATGSSPVVTRGGGAAWMTTGSSIAGGFLNRHARA